MRIDKYLAELGLVPRRQAKKMFKEGIIQVNKEVVTDVGYILKKGDSILCNGEEITYKPVIVIVLNKPIGYVCSDIAEGKYKSYRDVLNNCVYKEIVHVAGRLDADTTGLVLLTNDGDLNHRIISPKKKLVKVYEVDCENKITENDIKNLERGVRLDDGYITLPATVKKITEKRILLSIYEGKYHQVKRMLESIGNKVLQLHRSQIGKYILTNIKQGERQEIEEGDIGL